MDDDSYFFDDDDVTSSSRQEDDGEDPLDAFMRTINQKQQQQEPAKKKAKKFDYDELGSEDPMEIYYKQKQLEAEKAAAKAAAKRGGAAAVVEDDEDVNLDRRNQAIEALPPIDHNSIQYRPFRKDFYKVHPQIEAMTDKEISDYRKSLHISATGSGVPRLVPSFPYMGLHQRLLDTIVQSGFSDPTPVQMQCVPVGLAGRDLIGIAETGSGKTLAYLLPMITHVMDQPMLEKDDGPIGVCLCPTRELAIQIEKEAFRFTKKLGLRSTTLAGGLSKQEQFKECKRGCEIVIANPGRLIDMIKMKGTNMQRCTFFVLDEADRMFSMGFEYQMRSIAQHIRKDRQTLLFSATFPPKVENLARDLLVLPIRATVGVVGGASSNVTQRVHVVRSDEQKWAWISQYIKEILCAGQVLIFVKSKTGVEQLAQAFKDRLGLDALHLHGDVDQNARMAVMKSFKENKATVLIATDVAARGLDISTIRTVICYDMARDIETHTHRIGRTGRAGAEGTSWTLVNSSESRMAAFLVENMETAGQQVPKELMSVALHHKPFAAARLAGQTFDGKKPEAQQMNAGLGFGDKPKKHTQESFEAEIERQADVQFNASRKGAPTKVTGVTGFVSAGIKENDIKASVDDSDSDDGGLYAPGVSGDPFARKTPQEIHQRAFAAHNSNMQALNLAAARAMQQVAQGFAGASTAPPGFSSGAQQGFTPGAQQGITSGLPQGFSSGANQGFSSAPPQGFSSAPPQGFSSAPPQGFSSAPPQGFSSAPPQGFSSAPPQGFSSAPPQGFSSAPPQGFSSGPPQGYSSASHQGFSSGPSQGFSDSRSRNRSSSRSRRHRSRDRGRDRRSRSRDRRSRSRDRRRSRSRDRRR